MMSAPPRAAQYVQLRLPLEPVIAEDSPELLLVTRNLEKLVRWVYTMSRDTLGTTGELRVPWRDGCVVDMGPGKLRPKVMVD